MTDTATAPATHRVPEGLPARIQHYIDGGFVDSQDGDTFDVLDPSRTRRTCRRPPARRPT